MSEENVVDATLMIRWIGHLRRHEWLPSEWHEQDPYSLFVSYAEAMDWSSTVLPGGVTRALWGMNDASESWSKPGGGLIAWFQVGLNDGDPSVATLPLQAVAQCSWQALCRVGVPDIDGVDFLVPVQLARPSAIHLVPRLNIFDASDPATTTAAVLTVDAGSDDIAERRAAVILDGMAAFRTGPFAVKHGAAGHSTESTTRPRLGDLWLGSGSHPAVFEATLPEWTPEALGWLALLATEGARHAGVAGPTLISIERSR